MQTLAERTAGHLGISVVEARQLVDKLMRERWKMKLRIYDFLKSISNIKPPEQDQRRRIKSLSQTAKIIEAEAEAAVVVGDIEFKNLRKLRRLHKPTFEQRVQTSLGTTNPIPKDILDFYRDEHEALSAWLNSAN